MVNAPSPRLSSSEEATVRSSLWLIVGGLSVELGSAISGFVAARLLGPALLGVARFVSVVVNYVGYADLGLTAAMVRRTPILLGAGDDEEAERVRNVVFTAFLALLVLSTGVILASWGFGMDFHGYFTPGIMALLIATLWSSRVLYLYSKYLKAEGKFRWLGQRSILAGIATPLIITPLVVAFRLPGLLLGGVVINFLQLAVLLARGRNRFRPTVDWRRLRALLSDGLKMFATQHQARVLWGLELIILGFMADAKSVGLYGLAVGAMSFGDRIPSAFNQVVFRRMLRTRGQRGFETRPVYLMGYLSTPYAAYLLLSAISAGCSFLLYALVVRAFLPAYSASLTPMLVLVLGYTFCKAREFGDNSLNVRDRLLLVIVLQAVTLVLNVVLDVALITRYGILGAAIGSTIAYGVFSAVLILLATGDLQGRARALRFAGRLIAAGLSSSSLLAGLHVLLDRAIPAGRGAAIIERTALSGAAALVYVAATVVLFAVWFNGYRVVPFVLTTIRGLDVRIPLLSDRGAPLAGPATAEESGE